MDILVAQPPNIWEIREAFPLTGQEIFCWGDIIYNPSNGKIPSWLIAHEQVHQRQQGDDPQAWWDRYLIDTEWRFKQELEAHRMEYNVFCISPAGLNQRNRKRAFLKSLARRLSSPMYGRVATYQQCRMAIKTGR